MPRARAWQRSLLPPPAASACAIEEVTESAVKRLKGLSFGSGAAPADAQPGAAPEPAAAPEADAQPGAAPEADAASEAQSEHSSESDLDSEASAKPEEEDDPELLELERDIREEARAAEEARLEQRKADQARRAAERLAIMEGLQAPPEEMPPWFAKNVQRYYNTDAGFTAELRELQHEKRAAVEAEQLAERNLCSKCRRAGHRKWRGLTPYTCCEEHKRLRVIDELASVAAGLRDEFASEAAKAALRYKQEDDQRAEDARKEAALAEERSERLTVEACKLMAPRCRECEVCLDADYGATGTGPLNMCSAHSVEYDALCERLEDGPGQPQVLDTQALAVRSTHKLQSCLV